MTNTTSLRLALALMSGLAITTVASAARPADEEPDAVKKFKQTVEAQAKTILKLSHPLGKYKDIDFDGYKKVGPKHELTYTINWTGKEKGEAKEFATTYTFTVGLDKNDAIDGVEIAVAKDTCPSKAFAGANFVVGVFRVQVKKKVSAVTDDKELLEKIDKMDADALLGAWLKYVDAKPRK
jgi:hypothetical protein